MARPFGIDTSDGQVAELLGNWRHLKRILLDVRAKDIQGPARSYRTPAAKYILVCSGKWFLPLYSTRVSVAGSTLVRAVVGMQ